MSNEPIAAFLAALNWHCAKAATEMAEGEVEQLTAQLRKAAQEHKCSAFGRLVVGFETALRRELSEHYAKEVAREMAAGVVAVSRNGSAVEPLIL